MRVYLEGNIERELSEQYASISRLFVNGSRIPASPEQFEQITRFADFYLALDSNKKKVFRDLSRVAEADDWFAWCRTYLENMRIDQIAELISVAHSLDFLALYRLCAWHVANSIRNKSIEEIRQLFRVSDDYTSEERAEVERSISWSKPPKKADD